jgi:hypothetical protein
MKPLHLPQSYLTARSLRVASLSPLILGAAALFMAASHANSQVVVSGDLIANLQNSDLTATSAVWVNQATGANSVGNFSTIGGGDANVVTVDGFNGLDINTTAANAMVSAALVPTSITGNGSVTVEEWVNTTNLYSGFDSHNYVSSYGDASGSHTFREFGYAPADGNGSNAFGTGNFNDLGYASTPPTGAWALVDFTYDSTTNLASVYVDGTLNVSGNLATLGTTATDFLLGVGTDESSDPFAGNIGALRVEDGVLTQSQIASNYALGVGGEVAAAPEPSTYAMIAVGGMVLLFLARRRRSA